MRPPVLLTSLVLNVSADWIFHTPEVSRRDDIGQEATRLLIPLTMYVENFIIPLLAATTTACSLLIGQARCQFEPCADERLFKVNLDGFHFFK